MKTCFKCNQTLPLTEFYPHPQMKDGHLNKCRSCTKKDVANRVINKSSDHAWILSERERQRLKQREYRSLGKVPIVKGKAKTIICYKWKAKNPEKVKAHSAVSRAIKSGRLNKQPCQKCGTIKTHAHHEDYSKPLDVIWLCSKHHREAHWKT